MSESNLLELPFTAPPPPEPGRIVVSDAFELLRNLAPESVDLVVTDPPYESLQIHRARGTTTRLTTNWFATVPNERLPELLRETYRVLRPDRHFYLFCDEVTADVIKQQQKVGAARLPNGARRCSCGLVYWKEIVWAKTTLDGGRIRGGTGYHYRAASERILFFEKGKRALNDLGIPDVLMAPRAGVPGPAVKPGAVVRTLIAQSTAPGELVLDPFCGSGVAGVEARALDRRFLLGDIDLAYLDPSLAALAPHDAIVARAAVVMEEPVEPPELEALADGSAAEDDLDAARACGWLDADGATEVLDEFLDVRPIEREAAVRRFLRTEPPRPREPDRLRAWRAWALSGRRRS
ncbi:MAG: site-specific DNA-methyltransferase [Deltaproteobacteria bacterium]|jgi:site-specific DNA-methyltransferase (adenine-specific)|nr:MAG: site-specific DNA-methyltransferase [Deltaproteobacteria bacterium]